MLEKIYLALQERIIKHTEIRFVDLDYGQFEFDTRPGAIFPAVLINFDAPDIRDLGDNIQECNCIITLRLGVEVYSPSSSGTPEVWKQYGLKHFEIEAKLHQVIHGQDLDIDSDEGSCSSLSRISATTEPREDNLRIRVIKYVCRYEDYTTQDPDETTQADISIMGQIALPDIDINAPINTP